MGPKLAKICPYWQEQHDNLQDRTAHLGIAQTSNIRRCTKKPEQTKTESWQTLMRELTKKSIVEKEEGGWEIAKNHISRGQKEKPRKTQKRSTKKRMERMKNEKHTPQNSIKE